MSGNPLKYIDPTGEILFFFGLKDDLELVEDVANDQLHGVDLVIDQNGKAMLVPNQEQGPASPEQQAFADTLSNAIKEPSNIGITVTSKDSGAIFGQFVTATVDVHDIATAGPGSGVNSAALLAHEVAEQTAAQVGGLPFNRARHALAHPAGVNAQERVSGFTRLSPPSFNLIATSTGTIAGRHRRGNHEVTVTFHFVNGNLRRVTRQP